MKTKAYIKSLKHGSLCTNVLCMYLNFFVLEINIKGDISVQKIKVKKSIILFLNPSFCFLYANFYITHKLTKLFILAI